MQSSEPLPQPLTYRELIKFFLPVAAMTMIMMSSHNVISAALAKTVAPALALSAYSVAQSLSSMIQAPCWALTKLTTAVADSKPSSKNVMKVALLTASAVLLIMVAIAYTPLGTFVFKSIMGVNDALFDNTLTSFKVFLIMPLFSGIRSTYQGFVSLRRKTMWLTVGTMVRIIGMFLVALFLVNGTTLSGGIIGSLILLSGFIIETLINYFTGRSYVNKDAPDTPPDGKPVLSTKQMWIFFLPLITAQVINAFVNPGISAGLARVDNPEIAISSFFVARSLAWIFLGLGFRIHQVVLVFAKNKKSWQMVKRFVMMIGLVMAGLLAILAFTPGGSWVYANIIGVESDLAAEALKALGFFTLIPVFMFVAELYQGILLKERMANGITICKTGNVVALFISLIVLGSLKPELGGMIGGISILISFVAEAAISIVLTRKIIYKYQ